jgi:hypothetical protein
VSASAEGYPSMRCAAWPSRRCWLWMRCTGEGGFLEESSGGATGLQGYATTVCFYGLRWLPMGHLLNALGNTSAGLLACSVGHAANTSQAFACNYAPFYVGPAGSSVLSTATSSPPTYCWPNPSLDAPQLPMAGHVGLCDRCRCKKCALPIGC